MWLLGGQPVVKKLLLSSHLTVVYPGTTAENKTIFFQYLQVQKSLSPPEGANSCAASR